MHSRGRPGASLGRPRSSSIRSAGATSRRPATLDHTPPTGTSERSCANHVTNKEGEVMTKQITVGYDGSEPSREAVMWAAAEASTRHAHLKIVRCFDIPVTGEAMF